MRFGQSTADDVGRGGGMKTKRDSKGGATDEVSERERGGESLSTTFQKL